MSEDRVCYDASIHAELRRRLTRQRSGFGVDGEHSGNECRVEPTSRFTHSGPLTIEVPYAGAKLVRLFGEQIGMVAFGAFIKVDKDANLEICLSASVDGAPTEERYMMSMPAGRWTKVGVHVEVAMPDEGLLKASGSGILRIEPTRLSGKAITEVFGLNLEAVTFYEDHPELAKAFRENTKLYVPEIYFMDHDKSLHVDIKVPDKVEVDDGAPVVVKACNRCERFMPIDLEQERNALSFSNHCVKRAPCSHESFSKYEITNANNIEGLISAEPVASHLVAREDGTRKVGVHYGFQLECRVCKKYFVNMPLNPMRSATQHREDGLRRRAIEDLLMVLLGHQWIFKGFRLQTGREFDDYVWKQFGGQCFRCGVDLPTTASMALDHTMPLAYLWPLSENATCLCPTCNSQKHDLFPFEFYSREQLKRLADLTDIPLDRLTDTDKQVNQVAVGALAGRIEWFFDDFLAQDDYQKVRDDKLTADLVVASLQRVLSECSTGLHLVSAYKDRMGCLPRTTTIY